MTVGTQVVMATTETEPAGLVATPRADEEEVA